MINLNAVTATEEDIGKMKANADRQKANAKNRLETGEDESAVTDVLREHYSYWKGYRDALAEITWTACPVAAEARAVKPREGAIA